MASQGEMASETDKLAAESKVCQDLIKSSDAAKQLVDFTASRNDPFNPESKEENAWIGSKGGGGGGCTIL